MSAIWGTACIMLSPWTTDISCRESANRPVSPPGRAAKQLVPPTCHRDISIVSLLHHLRLIQNPKQEELTKYFHRVVCVRNIPREEDMQNKDMQISSWCFYCKFTGTIFLWKNLWIKIIWHYSLMVLTQLQRPQCDKSMWIPTVRFVGVFLSKKEFENKRSHTIIFGFFIQ